ncbi:MAG: hypothetical protein IKF05_03270 [Erysipelotrichaceae bacterium]|nr:hypothetical protein [Erysipelotrichaceae bacterium]
MAIRILTVCPEFFTGFRLKDTEIIDLRTFAGGSFRHVDESPYGGGAGMVLRIEPLMNALEALRKENSFVVLTDPRGRSYSDKMRDALLQKEDLLLICGHFEGVDERIMKDVDLRVSMGDYIVSKGELAALTILSSMGKILLD